MRRFASAFAFLLVLTVVLGSAGCGQRFDELGAGPPPTPADLASQALAALEGAGSAHVVFDASGGTISGTTAQLGIHFEGDASGSALAGDGEVRFPGGTVGARVLVDEHDAYVRFMGAWYHADSGIADALATAKAQNDQLLRDLTTPAALGQRFGDLVEGTVSSGPDVGGVSTWEFQGHLRGDAFARFIAKYSHLDLTANDRALLGKVAEGSRVVLVAGQDDHLPRRLELTLAPPKDLNFDSKELRASDGALSLKVELSDFGKDVSFETPRGVRPLDELFQQLFAGIG